jgi:methylated-DNA-protein-cysteine methyltransferase-like protein
MNEALPFFEKVWEITRKIPEGRVTTYGAIAKYLGTALSSRMVGWALNASKHVLPHVPAHRVVNKNGLLTGKFHFEGYNIMQELLQSEGVVVEDNKIQNFNSLFWEPSVLHTIDYPTVLKKHKR